MSWQTIPYLQISSELLIESTATLTLDAPNSGPCIVINVPNDGQPVTITPQYNVDNMGGSLLQVSGSLLTDNDIFVYGSISTVSNPNTNEGGGALIIGYGWLGSATQNNSIIAQSPSLIQMFNSSTPVQSGKTLPSGSSMYYGENQGGQVFYNTSNNNLYIWTGQYGNPAYTWVLSEINPTGQNNVPNYDTLFLVMSNGCTPANLNLGNLFALGNITLETSNASIALQAGGWIQWGSPSAKLAMTNATRGFSGSTL